MYMLPELRRKLILLSSIPPGEVVHFSNNISSSKVVIESIDEMTNSMSFRYVEEGRGGVAHMSLDKVITVFRASLKEAPYWRVVANFP